MSNLPRSEIWNVYALVNEYFAPEPNDRWQDFRVDQSPSATGSPWLEVLPLLLDRSRSTGRSTSLLSASLKTLGYSIASKGGNGSTHCQWEISRAKYYSEAVHCLKHELSEGTGVCDESAAAIMCLSMAELLIPTSRDGWIAHVRGIGRMMELCGPQSFNKPVSHQLFLGFRPLILVEACWSRQDTFLSANEWRTIPFSSHAASPLQILLGHGSILPSVLQKSQSLQFLSGAEKASMAGDIRTALMVTLQELDAWEQSMQLTISHPLFWSSSASATPPGSVQITKSCLWFPSLPVATALTYLWAFRAVCFSQLAQVLSSDQALASRTDGIWTCLDISGTQDCREKALAFHSKICQSIPFFMQDQMKFYGAASVTLPLMITQTVLFS
ncbi:hypothetical protein BO82DRAFT_381399 [Aspergillus uvarum CBS 121591]|uniref:Uncharacterized protein n=1 Tax=Aspergillus uvarum CBS 121591 TaxID=1448315 RepID=A0A319CG43_9EURO|nr:hypothetical protein BO82DRAFT_381399 [Aspergillus uvarum CBS 121591]PYH84595.1 hypothetical protein BO82DRAFT_381399 [Aspergillus uvarum CBS 121591]